VTSTRSALSSESVLPCDEAAVRELVSRWREDLGGTYRTWFLWPERLKNFRSLRRGIEQVSADIEAGTFGTAYRGSSLGIRLRRLAPRPGEAESAAGSARCRFPIRR
jgi:type II restriction enzyme